MFLSCPALSTSFHVRTGWAPQVDACALIFINAMILTFLASGLGPHLHSKSISEHSDLEIIFPGEKIVFGRNKMKAFPLPHLPFPASLYLFFYSLTFINHFSCASQPLPIVPPPLFFLHTFIFLVSWPPLSDSGCVQHDLISLLGWHKIT